MGINKFQNWIKKTFNNIPGCIVTNKCAVGNYDYVFIDLNNVLHRLSYYSDISEIHKKMERYIISILSNITINKKVYLAYDGVASYAKLVLQKERRKICENSSIHFTPGTNFMNKLSKNMRSLIDNIYVVCHADAELLEGKGEAESKIIHTILKHDNKSETTYLVYSGDSDMIVMTSSIYSNNTNNKIMIHNYSQTVSISNIIDSFMITTNIDSRGRDFMFVSLLEGNDYLPKLAYVNNNILWKSYKDLIINYPQGPYLNSDCIGLNYNFVVRLFRNIVIEIEKRWKRKFLITDLKSPNYKNYIIGLKWCSEMYIRGICEQTTFCYKDRKAIHPIGILIYMEYHMNSLQKRNNNSEIEYMEQMTDIDYAYTVLPKSMHHIIAKKPTNPNRNDIISIDIPSNIPTGIPSSIPSDVPTDISTGIPSGIPSGVSREMDSSIMDSSIMDSGEMDSNVMDSNVIDSNVIDSSGEVKNKKKIRFLV